MPSSGYSTTTSSSSLPKDVSIKIKDPDSSPDKSNATTSNNSSDIRASDIRAGKMWGSTSYDFTNDPVMMAAAKSKEFDFATDSPLSRVQESPGANITPMNGRVLFEPERNFRSGFEPEEVLVASSNSSFKRRSSLMRSKTKSRLLDPPEEHVSRSQNQKMGRKSQNLGKGMSDIEEDDPFMEDDLPERYKKMRYSALSVLQLLSLILIVAALVCSLTINVLKRITVFELELWKWEVMVLVVLSGRLVSGWGVRLVVFGIERNFLLRKRVLYFVYGLRNAVQNCVWLALVLVSWHLIFDEKVERVTHGKILPYVTKIWVCLLVGTVIWLLKTLLVKVMASSFHVTAFFDRIQEALFNQYVIETLSGPPLVEIKHEQEEEERVIEEVQKLQSAGAALPADLKANLFPKSGRVIGTPRKSTASSDSKNPSLSRSHSKKEEENGITIDHLHRLNQKNISAWNMKRLISIVRKGMVSTLHEKIQDSTSGDEAMVHITSENEATAAARKIFNNVAKPGSEYIQREDLMRYMQEDEVEKTLVLFEDKSDQKGISKRALKNWVLNVFRERRALALSLNDTKTAVNKLHQMLNVLVGVLIIVIWLLILKVATTKFFIFLSSQLLLVVFVFGNSCKTTFEAIVFLFSMHPFDVGDRVEIEGVQMVVEEMNILTTVFLKYDNHKIYYPNSVLSQKPIYNYQRSPDMRDEVEFSIHISTPPEKIAMMKERITSYINNNSDFWRASPLIILKDMEDMNRLQWVIWPFQKMNFQDMGERFLRRSLLIEEMIKIFRELDIEYRLLPQDVNVRNMPPVSSNRLPSSWIV